jgi:hypothetical protein
LNDSESLRDKKEDGRKQPQRQRTRPGLGGGRHPTNANDRDKIEKHQIAQGQDAFELWRRFFSHVRNLGLL